MGGNDLTLWQQIWWPIQRWWFVSILRRCYGCGAKKYAFGRRDEYGRLCAACLSVWP